MPEDNSPEDRISKLIKQTAPKPARKRRAPAKPAANMPTNNIVNLRDVCAGRDVNVNIGAVSDQRPIVQVQTGVGTINAKQKADVSAQLKRWLALRNKIRKNEMSVPAAWGALNGAMGVNSYHELTPEQLPAVFKWLREQTGILMSMKSAPLKVDGFRSQTIGSIKARCRQLGDMHYYVPYLVKTYGAESLTQLSDQQLQEVRAWLFNQRRGR